MKIILIFHLNYSLHLTTNFSINNFRPVSNKTFFSNEVFVSFFQCRVIVIVIVIVIVREEEKATALGTRSK